MGEKDSGWVGGGEGEEEEGEENKGEGRGTERREKGWEVQGRIQGGGPGGPCTPSSVFIGI